MLRPTLAALAARGEAAMNDQKQNPDRVLENLPALETELSEAQADAVHGGMLACTEQNSLRTKSQITDGTSNTVKMGDASVRYGDGSV
jgi:hypothetical protein